MANSKHLNILKQGVAVWNQWRDEHPKEIPDLREINLSEADLSNADLRGADLGSAVFIGATLKRVDFTGTDLTEANLERGDLGEAKLQGVNLEGANLREADLKRATLDFANLKKVDLIEANLYDARLVRADFSKANITGTILYGTARDDWIIDDINCDYVFWDEHGEIRTPKDRDFRPGEFEELYKQLPTFEYFFEHGFTPLDPLIMDQVVQAINQQHPEFELKLDSFHSRGQPHAVFTVIHKDHTEDALKQITASYEARLAALEGKQEQLMALFGQLTSNPQPQLISGCEQVIIGGSGTITTKRTIHTKRDYFERTEGDVTTGGSDHRNHRDEVRNDE